MAASVNNIAAAFSAALSVTGTPPSMPASSSSPVTAALFSTSPAGGGISISASWNPHSALPRSRRSSFLSLYGPPGPRPSRFTFSSANPKRRRGGVIVAGDRLPCSVLSYLADGAVRAISSSELTRGRKVVFLGVSAAFAPRRGCPGELNAEGLVGRMGEMRQRGAALVACVSANDVFVMRAWGESIGASLANGGAGLMMLSDPDAGMARAMGLAADFTGGAKGFGVRSENYCLVAADEIVKAIFREEDGVGFDEVIRAI
ncbi:Peroxiredoxin-2E-2, chloroplastic [Apostasia shenzhenica]|uniref:glutaredoxin-dependent peroxiredoxin n=1 Tax=Apostasia shenzhenica TaxID=1088818 RepID=A0A2I0AEC2_9ASPA|nr:Peroxiredoxin-2E-2, chloroplastic [Apostasia shenzhenica]